MPTDAASESARYRAFISYSHADAAFGRRLHHRLEAYGLPGRLVGRATPRGTVPRRLSPIFRDREELPADGDLSAQVRAALAQSAVLVVVCSPRAATSPWVDREVALFRELHPGRPILAALIEGNPAEAFPETLTAGGAEPLAADFREGRDGARLALLKLVAGIVGLGLDELIQRDAQRRMRGVMAVTAGSLAAMVAMGVLTLFALNARAQAERERAKAEGLVEFMITDLGASLESLGRLDVMSPVTQKALAYYADMDESHLPVDSQLRRARTITVIGQIELKQGRFDSALERFNQAFAATQAILAKAPADPRRIFAHAQSVFWLAQFHWERGDVAAARTGFVRYAEMANRLVEIDPANPEWRMEPGYAASNLGTLELRSGDPAKAEAAFHEALTFFQAMQDAKPGEDPDIQIDIADGYAWMADSQRAQRRFDQARASRAEERRILLGLRTPGAADADVERGLVYNALGAARIDLEQQRYDAALAWLRPAWARAKELAAADPTNQQQAGHRTAIGLFLTETLLAARAPLDEARAGLADCNSAAVAADQELMDFCAVLAARLARAEDRPNDPAIAYLRTQRERLAKVHRSPEWGVDFARELAN